MKSTKHPQRKTQPSDILSVQPARSIHYYVEGFGLTRQWREWYFTDAKGRNLNPTTNLVEAVELFRKLRAMIRGGKCGFLAARIVRVNTTRNVLVSPIYLQPKPKRTALHEGQGKLSV